MKRNNKQVSSKPIKSLAILVLMLLNFIGLAQADGKALFRQNCGACHSTTKQVLVGPGLEGINDKRSEEWLLKWIKDSQALVKSGDADAKAIFEEYNKNVMPPVAVTDDEIKAILSFIKTPPVEEPKPTDTAATAAPVVAKAEPWSAGVVLFVTVLIFAVVAFIGYTFFIRYRLKSLGFYSGNMPLRDRVSIWFSRNGKLVLIVVLLFVIAIMKSCIQELM